MRYNFINLLHGNNNDDNAGDVNLLNCSNTHLEYHSHFFSVHSSSWSGRTRRRRGCKLWWWCVCICECIFKMIARISFCTKKQNKKWDKHQAKQTQTHIPQNNVLVQQNYTILLSRLYSSQSTTYNNKHASQKIEKSDTKFTERCWVKFTHRACQNIDRPPLTRQHWQNPVTRWNSVKWKSTLGYNRNQVFSLTTF